MRIAFAGVFIAGVGLAGFAVFQTHQYISQMQVELAAARSQANTIEMVDVMIANRELRYGQSLSRRDVGVAKFPANAVPKNAITEVEQLFPGDTRSRIVLRSIDPMEPILTTKLTEPGKQVGINSHLSPGKRAFTISVNQSSAVAGFLRPGDRVDLFWTGRVSNVGEVTRLIHPHLRLIAVDQSADMDRATEAVSARSITVEVTPTQVAALAQAQASGNLSLALVGWDDDGDVGHVEMTRDQMLGVVREESAVEVEEKCHIRTRRGGDLVLIEIPCTN